MELANALADLARDHAEALFHDAGAFRGALDDYLDEGTATSGTINLLTDAVRLGALDGMLSMLDSGASPGAAVESAGQRLARERGSSDNRGCQWACAVLGFALGRIPEDLVTSLAPSDGPASHTSAPTSGPDSTSIRQSPMQSPMQSPPGWPGYGAPSSNPAPPPPPAPGSSQQPVSSAPSGAPAGYGGYGYPQAGGPAYGSWQQQPAKKNRTGLIVGLVAGALVLIVAVVVIAIVASSGGSGNNPGHTGPSASGPSASGSAPVAKGPVLHGTGYTVTMPQGWTDQTKSSSSAPGLDRLAVNSSSVASSTSNVAIAESSSIGVTNPEDVRSNWQNGLKDSDPSANVTKIPDRQIDGERAIGADVTRSQNGTTLQQTAYLVIHNGTGYTVVFTFRDGDATQSSVFDSFLSGWKWR